MSTSTSRLARAYAAAASALVSAVALAVVILAAAGVLTGRRIGDAWRALRGDGPAPGRPSAFDDDLAGRRETLDERERSLRKLEGRLVGELARVRGEREGAEAARAALAEERERHAREREALATARADAELSANVPILSRMDAGAILALVKSWDDARVVRTLRAMRPSKAAEVLEAAGGDPEFRRLPENAPPGARTRAERLAEELKKAP